MDPNEQLITEAIQETRVVRLPKQPLAIFGVTNLHYYVVTEPVYRDLIRGKDESVVRQGKVESQRPAIITPAYVLNLEGFSENARKYMESLAQHYGPHTPSLLYRYRHAPGSLEIVSGRMANVAHRIAEDLNRRGENMAAVIEGVDQLWDVSLLKFIYEYTTGSLASNVSEIQAMGLLEPEPGLGVPRGAVQQIEQLFREVEQGLDPKVLRQELKRWDLFDHYQDRFLGLFRRK